MTNVLVTGRRGLHRLASRGAARGAWRERHDRRQPQQGPTRQHRAHRRRRRHRAARRHRRSAREDPSRTGAGADLPSRRLRVGAGLGARSPRGLRSERRGDAESPGRCPLGCHRTRGSCSRRARRCTARATASLSRSRTRRCQLAPYGVSKLAAERYVSVYAKVYGLATASLRLFPVYGPRLRRHVMWDLMCKLRDDPDELVLEGDGTQVRDFLYVANAVDALLLAADQAPLEGEVYNASDGRAVTIRRGRRAHLGGDGPRSAHHVHGRRPSRGRPAVDGGHVAPAVSSGFRPRVGLEEGLAETVAWFRAESARP